MMQRVAVALITLATTTATADVCSVAIPRAPDNIRAEIEIWVRAEPRCSVELEVRVVPTEGGYYLFARDQQGRVRERIVPDGQSAGVLVASWVADDSQVRFIDAPPPSVERESPKLEIGETSPASPRSTRWVTVGGMAHIGQPGSKGIRGELDLAQRGAWTVSGVLAVSSRELDVFGPTESDGWQSGELYIHDVIGEAQVSRTSKLGRWHVSAAAALGIVHTSGDGGIGGAHAAVSGTTMTGGVSLLVGREIGASWAVSAGPVVTVYEQSLTGTYDSGMTIPIDRYEKQVMAFAGLRHRL